MRMLDLGCGKKGASKAFKEHGWEVVTLDIDERFEPDVVADVRLWSTDEWFDLVWASPPCDEFSREWMPWCKTGKAPDLSIVQACQRIIREVQPTWWVIENVRGAVPYLGQPRQAIGPYHLWGFFPDLAVKLVKRKKESMSSSWPEERARIPEEISLALLRAIESSAVLI